MGARGRKDSLPPPRTNCAWSGPSLAGRTASLFWLGRRDTQRPLKPAQCSGCPGPAPQHQAQPVMLGDQDCPTYGPCWGGWVPGSTASSGKGTRVEALYVRVTSSDASGLAGRGGDEGQVIEDPHPMSADTELLRAPRHPRPLCSPLWGRQTWVGAQPPPCFPETEPAPGRALLLSLLCVVSSPSLSTRVPGLCPQDLGTAGVVGPPGTLALGN